MKWTYLLVLVLGAITLVSSDDDLDLDVALPTVDSPYGKLLDNLPINKSSLPKPEEVERAFKEKCIQNGGEDAYIAASNARPEAEKCIRGLIDFNNLTAEMERAKPTGDLDEVFRGYCRKSPDFKNCILGFVEASNGCLTDAERGSKQLIQNITDQLLGFVCFKEGDRIALFIAEGGPECLTDKKDAVINCINSTFSKHIPAGTTPSLSALPQLLVGAEECKDVCSLQRCVVRELEKCKEPTPANIVQAMFDFVLKVTPCKNCKAERLQMASGSSGVARFQYLSLILSTVFVSILLH